MENSTEEKRPVDPIKESIRRTVRYFYDVQKLRIAAGNRTANPDDYRLVPDAKNPGKEKKVKKHVSRKQMNAALDEVLASVRGNLAAEEAPAVEGVERPAPPTLDEADRQYLGRQNAVLMSLEADTLDRLKTLLKPIPIADWLLKQKGIGVTLAGVLISEIDIRLADTPSALWAYAGLHTNPENGLAVRRQRGQKANWNGFLKTKVVKVLADCFIKANSPWRSFYDSYKLRKSNQMVQTCMLCNGSGRVSFGDDVLEHEHAAEPTSDGKNKKCPNCKGTGGPVVWGKSGAHRDQASKRYMVKQFLLEFWKQWRTLEGLPIVESYAEAALGREHGDHGGMPAKAAPKMNTRTGQQFRPAPRNAHP